MIREIPTKRRPARGSLLAICVGLPKEVEVNGERVRSGIWKSPVEDSVRVSETGLEGDGQADLSVHGGVDKAVYAYDEESADYWRACLARPELSAGAFGENLRLSGLPESEVCVGDVLAIGSARLEVSQPRQPCFKLGLRFGDASFPKRFIKSGRVGYYLRVLEPGRIRAGDEVVRIACEEHSIDIARLVEIWLDRSASRESLESAAGLGKLAEAWRAPLRERLERGPTLSP